MKAFRILFQIVMFPVTVVVLLVALAVLATGWRNKEDVEHAGRVGW